MRYTFNIDKKLTKWRHMCGSVYLEFEFRGNKKVVSKAVSDVIVSNRRGNPIETYFNYKTILYTYERV